MTNKKIKYQPVPPEITELVEDHGNNPEALLEVLGGLTIASRRAFACHRYRRSPGIECPPTQSLWDGHLLFHALLRGAEKDPAGVRRASLLAQKSDRRPCTDDREFRQQSMVIGHAGDDYTVERTSCLGLCDRAPAILVEDEQAGPVTSMKRRRSAKAGAASRPITRQPRSRRNARDDSPDRQNRP